MPSFLQQRPALKVALALTCGILLADRFSPSLLQMSILVILLSTAGVLLYILRSRVGLAEDFISPLLLVALIALGSWKFTLDKVAVTENSLVEMARQGSEATVLGTVLDPPPKMARRSRDGESRARRMVVRVDAVEIKGEGKPVRGDLLVFLPRNTETGDNARNYDVGDQILISGRIEEPRGPRNPGDFDFRRYLLLNEISAVVSLNSTDDISLVTSLPRERSLRTFIADIRSGIALSIDRTVGGDEGAFLRGILLGDRSEIPTEVKTSFINAGVVHVLAVSGLHVGLVTLVFLSFFSFIRAGRTLTIPLTILSLLFYMLLTGSAPSVMRATVMAVVILLAKVLQKRSDVFNSLAVAAIIIYYVDAKELFNPGFQLSFAAVTSILFFYPKIAALVSHFPERLRSNTFVDFLWKLFSVSFAAQVGTLPFTVAYFGKISVVSLLTNLFVIPAVGVGLALGFIVAFFDLFSGWLAGIYGAAARAIFAITLKVVGYSGELSFAYVSVPSFQLLDVLLFYTSVVFLFSLRDRLLRKKLALGLLLLANVALLQGLFDEGSRLRITVIDVGQGDASLIQFPSGKTLLIDGGPKTFGYDAGERIVVPFLKRSVKKLDAVIITHPHADHLGGIEAVLRSMPVGTVYDAGHPATSRMYTDYMAAVKEKNISYAVVRTGDTIDLAREARIFVLHPTRRFVQVDSVRYVREFNNSSVVVKIVYRNIGCLFTGDAEDPSEDHMLLVYDGFLHSELIKVGHHGSKTSSTEGFVEAVKPKYAAISVGERNKFNHPSPEVVERYKSMKAEVLRTDMEGALIFETDGVTVRRVHWR